MLQIAQLLTIACFVSNLLEKDCGRCVSSHMEFNEKLAQVMVWAWVVYWVVELIK